jgi:hypothetical protein
VRTSDMRAFKAEILRKNSELRFVIRMWRTVRTLTVPSQCPPTTCAVFPRYSSHRSFNQALTFSTVASSFATSFLPSAVSTRTLLAFFNTPCRRPCLMSASKTPFKVWRAA